MEVAGVWDERQAWGQEGLGMGSGPGLGLGLRGLAKASIPEQATLKHLGTCPQVPPRPWGDLSDLVGSHGSWPSAAGTTEQAAGGYVSSWVSGSSSPGATSHFCPLQKRWLGAPGSALDKGVRRDCPRVPAVGVSCLLREGLSLRTPTSHGDPAYRRLWPLAVSCPAPRLPTVQHKFRGDLLTGGHGGP